MGEAPAATDRHAPLQFDKQLCFLNNGPAGSETLE
jgi:hypothetical protein